LQQKFWGFFFFFPEYNNNFLHVQILRVFSDSTGKVEELKGDLENARMLLGAQHKQLQQQWSRSVTLRHVISLLDQIDKVAQVRSTELLMGGCFFFFFSPLFFLPPQKAQSADVPFTKNQSTRHGENCAVIIWCLCQLLVPGPSSH
jgi:hypothetical protein